MAIDLALNLSLVLGNRGTYRIIFRGVKEVREEMLQEKAILMWQSASLAVRSLVWQEVAPSPD